MVIVLIHSVKAQPLILREALRGASSLKRRVSKTQCKGASLFCQNKQFVSKNVFFACLGKRFWLLCSRTKLQNELENLPEQLQRCPVPRRGGACQAPYVLQRDGCVRGDEWRVPGHPLERRHCRKINSLGLCRHLSGLSILDIDLSIFHIGCSTLLKKKPTG